MSIFARKLEPREGTEGEPEAEGSPAGMEGSRAFGIADVMRLLKSLPVEQHADLVVRVVRVTLGSLNVRVDDIIADASRKEKSIQETISSLRGRVADLEEQLEARRRELGARESELHEISRAKERLQMADRPLGAPVTASAFSDGAALSLASIRKPFAR